MKNKVSAIPAGYNSVTPYLIVNNAAKAIDFYKTVFGASEALRMNKPDGKVGHAELDIGNAKIMLADEFPEIGARCPQTYGGSPISIYLYMEDVDTVTQRAVANGAKLLRPVQDMFYGDRSAMIEDPFGHKWGIATHIEDVPMDELKKRVAVMYNKK